MEDDYEDALERAERRLRDEADALGKALDDHLEMAEEEMAKTNASEFVDRAMRRQLLTEQWMVQRLAVARTIADDQQKTINRLLKICHSLVKSTQTNIESMDCLMECIRAIDERTRA